MENSRIEWTHHTFNPWEGCTKVSAGCKHCYAETQNGRFRQGEHWGPSAPRLSRSEKYWHEPLKWNKRAAEKGVKERVFCSSMGDVFEIHADPAINQQLKQWRHRLFELINETPNLIWLLLTKRPENVMLLADYFWQMEPAGGGRGWWPKFGFPRNVWIGTSVENQETANLRIPSLVNIPASKRFLSCEPLLGPVDFEDAGINLGEGEVDWVIVGGESGPKARPMHPEWAYGIKQQASSWGVPFFFKQWGAWAPEREMPESIAHRFSKPSRYYPESGTMIRAGKKHTGRLLHGKEYNEIPNS